MSTYTQTEAHYQSVLKQFAEHKACAVLRTPIVGACTPAMNAAVDGGFKLVEFAITTPGCLDSVAEYASRKRCAHGCRHGNDGRRCQESFGCRRTVYRQSGANS